MNNRPVAYGMLTFCKNCGEQNPYSVKELDEQFKKGFEAGKEEGWKAHKFHHPVKELKDAITLLEKYADKLEDERPNKGLSDVVLECVEILRKAQEK